MESKETMIAAEKSDEKIIAKKEKHPISLLSVRIAVCFIIFCAVIFVKINNPCIFEAFRFWYQNNVCEEKISTEELKEKSISLFFKAKEKALNAVSKTRLNYFNR